MTSTTIPADGASRAKIAIVDDDEGAREALAFLLDVLGCRAEGFRGPADFLNVGHDGFSRLILDQHLPGMTGVELARRLRGARLTIPIMLISGNLSPDIVRGAIEAGVDTVCPKPVSAEALSAFIDGAAD